MAKVNDVLLRAQDSVELQEPPVGEEKGVHVSSTLYFLPGQSSRFQFIIPLTLLLGKEFKMDIWANEYLAGQTDTDGQLFNR